MDVPQHRPRRPDGVPAHRRQGGHAGRARPRAVAADAVGRRAGRTRSRAARRAVLDRPRRCGRATSSAASSGRWAPSRGAFGLLDGIASIAADDAAGTLVIRLDGAGPGLPVPARAAVRRRRAPRRGPKPPRIVPATGPVPDRGARPARTSGWSATATSAPGRRSAKPDGYPDVIEARCGIDADEAVEAIRTGAPTSPARAVRPPAADGSAAKSDPGLVREAASPADVVGVPQHARAAVRPPRRPPRGQPRDRPARRRGGLRGARTRARATCHILPPTSPGYRPSCPERDLREARRLVRRSGTARRARDAVERHAGVRRR